MPSGRDRGRNGSIFENQPQGAPSGFSLQDADSAIFGKIADVDKAKQIAKPTSIFEIYPDPTQPRRAIPSAVRAVWNGDPHGVADMLLRWIDLVDQERAAHGIEHPFVLQQHIDSASLADEAERPDGVGPIELSLLELINVAAGIYRDGLINPITVARTGVNSYMVETGERRWLAYHLLHAYTAAEGHENKFERIPAKLQEQSSVWRQATENSARANLNAIGRARQYSILMMDLWHNDSKEPLAFTSYSDVLTAGGSDRDYYAQVIELRPPYGKGDQLLQALGGENRMMLARCRDLLALPDVAWQIGDDLNVAEDTLLKWTKLSTDEAITAAQSFAKNVTSRDNPKGSGGKTAIAQFEAQVTSFQKQAERLKKATPEDRQQALEIISKTKKWLSELEKQLNQQ